MIISLAVDSDLAARFLLTLDSDEGLDGLEGEEHGEGNLTEPLDNVLSLAAFPQFPLKKYNFCPICKSNYLFYFSNLHLLRREVSALNLFELGHG